jgi:hypothetical protein
MIDVVLQAEESDELAKIEELKKALAAEQISYSTKEGDTDVTFSVDDSHENDLVDVLLALGINLEDEDFTAEDDWGADAEIYRVESAIDSVVEGADPRQQLSSILRRYEATSRGKEKPWRRREPLSPEDSKKFLGQLADWRKVLRDPNSYQYKDFRANNELYDLHLDGQDLVVQKTGEVLFVKSTSSPLVDFKYIVKKTKESVDESNDPDLSKPAG